MRRSKNKKRDEPRQHKNVIKPSADFQFTDSTIQSAFDLWQAELDSRHDKLERIVKLSRDITIESKRAIFLLHRASKYLFIIFANTYKSVYVY